MRYFKRSGFVVVTMILMFFTALSVNVKYIPEAVAAQSASQEEILRKATEDARRMREEAEAARERKRQEDEAAAAERARREKQEAAAAAELKRKEAEAAAERMRIEAEERARREAEAADRARIEAEAAAERKRKEAEAAAERARIARIEAEANAERILKASFDTYDMVLVQGGVFTMGCTQEQAKDCKNNEKPAHQVTLSDFYIGKYPVTQAQWHKVMGNNPSAGSSVVDILKDINPVSQSGGNNSTSSRSENRPVENVSWNDVQKFINKLNEMTGGNYRLPTEAEWEYAARGGSQSLGYKHSGSNNIKDVGQYTMNWGTTITVGTKMANELGIHDMSGNVFEWVYDWQGNYNSSPQTNPQGPSSGSKRVARGGSWNSVAARTRVSDRSFAENPDKRRDNVGFRLAHSTK